jgi:hypothetical protein
MAIGFWHPPEASLLEREALNALDAAQEANTRFPGTVWGIVLSTFTWMSYYRSWMDSVKVVEKYRDSAHELGLQIGIRLDICVQIVEKLRRGGRLVESL